MQRALGRVAVSYSSRAMEALAWQPSERIAAPVADDVAKGSRRHPDDWLPDVS